MGIRTCLYTRNEFCKLVDQYPTSPRNPFSFLWRIHIFHMAFRACMSGSLLVLSVLQLRAAAGTVDYNVTGYDVGPDWSKDPFPPYPPLTNPDGNLIDAQNVRGTRLFGYTGC